MRFRKLRQRHGFTLVELIVVMAILGIVSSAIMTIFQYTSRSFVTSSQRAAQQYEVRTAMDKVKKELSVSQTVIVSDVVPAILPTDGGYCFYDHTNHYLRLRTLDGDNYIMIAYLSGSPNAIFEFLPIMTSGEYNSIRLLWQIGDYNLSTDVFIQNMAISKGSVTTTYDMGDGVSQGIYIEFY